MLALFIWLSCFSLFVVGNETKPLFLADMTCRYYAYHLSQKYWDSVPIRLKEYGRVYRLCTMEVFRPHSISLLTDLFTDATGGKHKAFAKLVTWYDIITPRAHILEIAVDDCAQAKPISHVTRAHIVVVCSGSNGTTFARGETGGLFDEVVFLNYVRGKPDMERIAGRALTFQQKHIPAVTEEKLFAFYRQRLARCPSVLPISALPITAGMVELCLSKTVTDYHPRTLGADFVTEFGLLYHLSRSHRLVDNDDKMFAGLRQFFPKLKILVKFPYIPESKSAGFGVPWAPPFHFIRPHQPRVMYFPELDGSPDDLLLPITEEFDAVIFPDYSKKNFLVCQLGPTKITMFGTLFAAQAKVILNNPPNTSERRLLIAYLLRAAYSSDILDPSTGRRYDSINWYFAGRSVNAYIEQAKK